MRALVPAPGTVDPVGAATVRAEGYGPVRLDPDGYLFLRYRRR